MIYEFPAIVSYDTVEHVYYVNFSDMSNCFTDGETLYKALDNASDVLGLMLSDAECNGDPIPVPSNVNAIKLKPGEIVAIIEANTDVYSRVAV